MWCVDLEIWNQKILKEEAKKLRAEGHTHKEFSQKLNINLFCARHMCTYNPMSASKVGPKFKITNKKDQSTNKECHFAFSKPEWKN